MARRLAPLERQVDDIVGSCHKAAVHSEPQHDPSLDDLEWPRLCALIAARTASDLGRARALHLRAAPDQETAELRLSVMSEVMNLAHGGTALPAQMIRDTSDVWARIERGGVASESELAQIRRLLLVAVELTRFGLAHQDRAPQLARLLSTSDELPALLRELSLKLDEDGSLHDDASPALAKARAEVRSLRAEMKRRVDDLIRRYREALQDAYFAERDGRYVLPVRADAPFRVEGIVLGTSASGSTLYVEPQELGQLGNRLGLAEGEVERQIAIILAELTLRLRPHVEELEWAQDVAVRADLLWACAQFALDIDARVLPFADTGSLFLKGARHPLLCASDIEVVPSDLQLDSTRGLVLSGPNAGGKTVALKTLGLCALLQSTGLPVPADEGSKVGFFDEVLCDIGDDQSLAMSLSTFSGHVERVRSILEDASLGTLVLFDELMGGTDPDEGAVLAIATIDQLVQAEATVCVTTHYEPLKHHAAQAPHLENGAVGFDFSTMEPTFVVDMGRPGASSALIVAEKHGLPRHLTERAESLLPELLANKRKEALQLEAGTARLREETRLLELARTEQDTLNRHLARELEKLQEQRRRSIEIEGDELRSEIRQARAELRTLRKEMARIDSAQLRRLEAGIDDAASLTRVGGKIERATTTNQKTPVDPTKLRLGPGDLVQVEGFSTPAQVLELPQKGQVRVLVGVMKMSVPLTKIVDTKKPVSTQGPRASTTASSGRRSHPHENEGQRTAPVRSQDLTLNLRGQRVEESLLLVDHFLDELLRSSEPGGYILHGHGTGALKEAVRTHLRGHDAVEFSRPAERDEGGDAFTVFWLAL